MNLDWLIGKACTRITATAEGAFAFEFGDCGINISCAWRILSKGKIVLAHQDQGQPYGLGVPIDVSVTGMKILGEKQILSAFADEVIGDIRIDFGDFCIFEAFNDSSGYEAWTMTDPNKYFWVSASGGEVSGYPRA